MSKTELLRLLGVADAVALATLEQSIFADAWSAAQYATLLGQKHFVAAGSWRGTDLLGFVSAYSIEKEMEIVNVGVRADLRRQGLALDLLYFFLDQAQDRQVERIFLEVRVSNRAALGLYARTGFVHTGLRKGYYTNTGEDALLLTWTNLVLKPVF